MQWLDGWADTRAEFEKIRRNSIDTTTSRGADQRTLQQSTWETRTGCSFAELLFDPIFL